MWDRLKRTLGLFIGPDFVSVEGVPICQNPSHRLFFWSPPPGEGRRRVQWSMVGDHKLNDNSDLVSFAPPATVERGRRSVSDPKSIPPSLPDMIEHIVCPGKMYKELGFGLFYFSHWYLSVCSLLFVCPSSIFAPVELLVSFAAFYASLSSWFLWSLGSIVIISN